MVKTAKTYETSASQEEFSKLEQTLIIYDWDDTLCPSCWIQDQAPVLSFFRPPPANEELRGPLKQLEESVAKLLTTSMQLGKVVIVTNAQEPWVETSCRNFLPGLMPFLAQIPVRYAHAVYEDAFGSQEALPSSPVVRAAEKELQRQASIELGAPGMYSSPARQRPTAGQDATGEEGDEDELAGKTARTDASSARGGLEQVGAFSLTTHESSLDLEAAPQQWKEAAFREELRVFYTRYENQSWKNVISIGDGLFERDALRKVASGRPTKNRQCRTKTAKLLDEPTIEELIKQLKTVHDGISLIVQYDGNLDLEIDEEDLDFDIKMIEVMMGDGSS